MSKGMIILLNGVSSSGKAAIAHFLQEIMPEPYVRVSIDDQLHNIPERLMSIEGEDLAEEDAQEMHDLLPLLISAIHQSIVVYANNGIHLIVDHVIQRQDWLEECMKLWADFRVLFVGVYCGLDELQRRESERQIVSGLARAQLDAVHSHTIYDVEVNTCLESPLESAQIIKRALEDGRSNEAFDQLRTQSGG